MESSERVKWFVNGLDDTIKGALRSIHQLELDDSSYVRNLQARYDVAMKAIFDVVDQIERFEQDSRDSLSSL